MPEYNLHLALTPDEYANLKFALGFVVDHCAEDHVPRWASLMHKVNMMDRDPCTCREDHYGLFSNKRSSLLDI